MRRAILVGVSIMLIATVAAVCGETAPTSSAPASRRAFATGRLVKVDGNTLVMSTPRGDGGEQEVNVPTDRNTEFQMDYKPVRLADLKPGMRLFIDYQQARTPGGFIVIASPPDLSGTISKVDGATVVVRVWRQLGKPPEEVSVATDTNTGVSLWGRAATVGDLKAGMKVHVIPEKGTAARIVVMPDGGEMALRQLPQRVSGTLVKVEGKDMVINIRLKQGKTEEVTVTVGDNAEFLVEGEVGKLADLKPGMNVFFSRYPQTAHFSEKVTVRALAAYQLGRVIRVDGLNVILGGMKPGTEDNERAIATDKNTKVVLLWSTEYGEWYRPGPGRLQDLTRGMRVDVLPMTGTASKIIGYAGPIGTTQPASRP